MLAVLENAVEYFQKYVLARNPRGKQLFQEAEEWFLEKESEALYSFENICDTLGLHPDHIRKGLLVWKEAKLKLSSVDAERAGRPKLAKKPRQASIDQTFQDGINSPMPHLQPELTIIALSLWLIVFLGLTCVVYSLVSMWKENRFGWPLTGHHLVHRRHRRLLRCYCPSRRIRPESQIVGEGHTQNRSCDGGLNMQITEITIHPTNEDLVKAYVSIVFDNCFMVGGNQSHARPHGSFPLISNQEAEGRHATGILLFRPTLKRERMIEQAILAQYEKVVGGGDVPPSTTANKHQG